MRADPKQLEEDKRRRRVSTLANEDIKALAAAGTSGDTSTKELQARVRRTSLVTSYILEPSSNNEYETADTKPVEYRDGKQDGVNSNQHPDRWKRMHRKSIKYVPKANVLYSGPPKKLVLHVL